LGSIADGDIGSHFPPSDPEWRDVASDRFLLHALERLAAQGGSLRHADLTIICEKPKIGPHRAAMIQRLVELTGLAPGRVSVKATTTEKLGFTGRGEGVAAQAVATVRLPADKDNH
jgi:2-C-methyl-D-erythritol 4-phosphate cytidylyltransferase/2-C-methyl-D-erythritol 2,4-cyclodiphosphate synthase